MKKILSILLVLISVTSFAQTWQPSSQYTKPNGVWAANVLRLPSDTVNYKQGLAQIGYNAYIGNGIYWVKMANSSSIYWDSVLGKPTNFPTTYALSNNVRDSILARVRYIDTAAMLSPYARTTALGGYIPYTGATSAIDLNAKTVVNISKLGINTTTVPTILLRVIGDNNSTSRISLRGYSSDANSSSMRVTKFRGTVAAPQAPLSGDNLGKFELAGYGTTSSDGYPQATFEGLATENWGATARGSKVQFKVTPNTTTTQAIALTINQDKSAVFESSVTGTSLIKTGGTSSQFLKADGSVTTTIPSGSIDTGRAVTAIATGGSLNKVRDSLSNVVSGGYVPYTGATGAVNLGAYDLTVNTITVGKGGGSVASNTVFGLQAGAGINTGTENVFIAYQAGKVNTSGARNVVIGSQAGKALSSGVENTIVGQFAGANLTAGSRNSYFGHQAGITDAGNDNVAIGDYSYNSGGASQNTYVGSASGKLNSTANNNTGVGFNVLAGLTTGGSNVGLGAQAGRYISGGSVANTTATNSIYIGYSTYALADGQTNQIVIGYNETGLGSNTTILGNSSTLTTAVRGNLLLGTTTDSGKKLQVNGTTTTAGFAASGEVLTVTATVSEQYYHVFTGAVGQTLTLLSPSANNLQYVIINNSANTVTVAAAASTNIVNTVGSSVATITLIANQRVFIIADGNNKYYQIF